MICEIPGCERKRYAKNRCQTHYKRLRAGDDSLEIVTRREGWTKDGRPTCIVPGCTNFASPRGVCRPHHALRDRWTLSDDMIVALFTDPRCEICGACNNLQIDHDHACCSAGGGCDNCVRGLLCGLCNRAIGLLGDDSDRLRVAADYLERHNA